jgi:hypothetical protein
MKKIILFSLIATIAITTACNKDTTPEATPPVGFWDELLWIPILESGATAPDMKQLTWMEMIKAHADRKVNLDTLKYIVQTIEFRPDAELTGIMRITIHHGDAQPVPADCRNASYIPNVRTEYMEIRYTIDVSSHGGKNDINEIVVGPGSRYTGAAFGVSNPTSPCSPIGEIVGISYDYSYEDTNPKRMRLMHFITPTQAGELGIRSIHILEQRPE